MLWLAWSSLSHGTHKFVLQAPAPATSSAIQEQHSPRILDWAQGINLPAVTVVTPIEFALRRANRLPDYRIQFYGCWLAGLLCWYMAGRFADAIVGWRKTGALQAAPRADVAFILLALPSTILMAAAFGFSGKQSQIISAWAVAWLAITSADFLFRVAQLIRHRRRPDFSRR